ncbi:MAG: hypothetical protein IT497_06620 [Ottowia sp.]|nr:hypothetical protein [Ottowia sp.]
MNASGVTINDGNSGANYAVTTTGNSTSSITAKAVSLTAPAAVKTYDGGVRYTAQTIDLTTLSKQLIAGDTVTAATVAYTDKNVGSNKKVILSGTTINDGNSGGNYVVSFVDGQAGKIVPVSLKTMGESATTFAGMAIPELGVSYEGFIPGESVANLISEPEVFTSATSASLPGEYPVIPFGGEAVNYTFNYKDGELTLLPNSISGILLPSDRSTAVLAVVGGLLGQLDKSDATLAQRHAAEIDGAHFGCKDGAVRLPVGMFSDVKSDCN